MQSIQEVFNQIKELKEEEKTIREEYKDLLAHIPDHEEATEKLNQYKEQKKSLELKAQSQMGARYEKLEELRGEIKDYRQMLSDIAMTTLMKGETIEVVDEYDNLYEPNYAVSFKKTSAKAQPKDELADEIADEEETKNNNEQ